MVHDAEAHAAEDKSRKEKIEKHNTLDSLIYSVEKTLKENEGKLTPETRAGVDAALADAKKDLTSDDVAKLDAARQRLETEMHKIAEILYKSDAGTGGAAGSAPGGSETSGEDVIDAEYTEEK